MQLMIYGLEIMFYIAKNIGIHAVHVVTMKHSSISILVNKAFLYCSYILHLSVLL